MNVTLLDHMGSDLDVVNAARVSFDKESEYQYDPYNEVWYLDYTDEKLIDYLAKHKHWSPFSHCFVKFRIKAPIFVARQLQKHVVGLAWNEVSRRYVDSEPEIYIPEKWRERAQNVKQGSSDKPVNVDQDMVRNVMDASMNLYLGLLEDGVCPEQARMVIPQAMYTEWIWSGSLYAFARVCKQRLDSHAQAETRWIAEQIVEHMNTLFPISWEALMENP